MSRRIDPQLLDEQLRLTLRDMCRICGVHAEYLMELVDEGIIAPQAPARRRTSRVPRAAQSWHFDGIAVVRVQRAIRLQQDLGVNLPGVALALDLLEEMEALRQRGP
ncbi:MAG: chaperone modulator CbpM [Gammaproteobacteria bacterium]|nr:chaperone modulator CbpM [Gammaproteobacteria bacterium]